MKKPISILLAIVLISLLFASCNNAKTDVSVEETNNNDNSFTEYELTGTAQAGNQTDSKGRVGVEIKSARITENWDGVPSVIVTYLFSHYGDGSEDTLSFYNACDYEVYQNGVALEITSIDDYELKGNYYAEIKPGYTGEIEIIYKLNDTTTDLVVEVTDDLYIGNLSTSRTFHIK